MTLQVQFIKSALGVGGIISGTTFSDTTAFYKEFLRAAAAQVRCGTWHYWPAYACLPGCACVLVALKARLGC